MPCCRLPACCRSGRLGAAGILEVLLLCVFSMDIIVSFFVGYYDEAGLLVMEHIPVAYNYARWAFC